MPNCCEICERWLRDSQRADASPRIAEVAFGRRRVMLCQTHAFLAAELGVTTIGGLCLMFRENNGRRSLLARRSPSSPAPGAKEQRKRAGRRASDLN
jgi:hypothetical protein